MSSSSKTSTGLRSDPVRQRSREVLVKPLQTSARFRTLQKTVSPPFPNQLFSHSFAKGVHRRQKSLSCFSPACSSFIKNASKQSQDKRLTLTRATLLKNIGGGVLLLTRNPAGMRGYSTNPNTLCRQAPCLEILSRRQKRFPRSSSWSLDRPGRRGAPTQRGRSWDRWGCGARTFFSWSNHR